MFGNRGLGWKLTAALVAIAGMGTLSALRAGPINPALWKCAAEPARWHDTLLWISRAQVVSAKAGEFTIDVEGIRLPVRGEAPAPPGHLVELRAWFRAEGPHLQLTRGRALSSRIRLRWLAEGVSILVLAGVLLNFRRHFVLRPKVVQVKGA